MMVDLCLDSLEGVGWLTIDNQQGEGEGISKRLFRFQDCSKLMELWHLRKLQCKTVEPGWCGGLKLFRKSTGTWYIYACTYIIYKQIHIYIYIQTYTIYIHICCFIYLMPFGCRWVWNWISNFSGRGLCSKPILCVPILRGGPVCNLFFLFKGGCLLRWWNTAGGWRPFVSGQKKFRSFPDLPFMNLSWVVLRLDEWYICPDPAFSTLTKQDAPSIQDTVRLVSLDWTSRNKHQPISSLAARTEFR